HGEVSDGRRFPRRKSSLVIFNFTPRHPPQEPHEAFLLAFAQMKRFAAAIAATLALAAWGQGYPHRPVTITVPFAAGGPTDTIARIMAERMSRTLGQPV